jgi:hypothetical protein
MKAIKDKTYRSTEEAMKELFPGATKEEISDDPVKAGKAMADKAIENAKNLIAAPWLGGGDDCE